MRKWLAVSNWREACFYEIRCSEAGELAARILHSNLRVSMSTAILRGIRIQLTMWNFGYAWYRWRGRRDIRYGLTALDNLKEEQVHLYKRQIAREQGLSTLEARLACRRRSALHTAWSRWVELKSGRVNLCRYTVFWLMLQQISNVRRVAALARAFTWWEGHRSITGVDGRQGFVSLTESHNQLLPPHQETMQRFGSEIKRLQERAGDNVERSAGVWSRVGKLERMDRGGEEAQQQALEAMSEQLADEVLVREGWTSVGTALYGFICRHTGCVNLLTGHPGTQLLSRSMRALNAERSEMDLTRLPGKPGQTRQHSTKSSLRLRVSKMMQA